MGLLDASDAVSAAKRNLGFNVAEKKKETKKETKKTAEPKEKKEPKKAAKSKKASSSGPMGKFVLPSVPGKCRLFEEERL